MATHRLKGNPDNIYRFRSGWYLNWECRGQVYRKLFSDSVWGGAYPARAAAVALRELLEAHRPYVEAMLGVDAALAVCCNDHRKLARRLLGDPKRLAAKWPVGLELAKFGGRLVDADAVATLKTLAKMAGEGAGEAA